MSKSSFASCRQRRLVLSVQQRQTEKVQHHLETDSTTAWAVRFSPNDAARTLKECTLRVYSRRSLGCVNSFL